MKLFLFLLTSIVPNVCDAFKILIIFPNPSKSHGLLGEGYVRNLLKAGHEITYITSVPLKTTSKSLRQIDVSINFEHANKIVSKIKAEDFFNSHFMWEMIWGSMDGYYPIVNNTISNRDVQKLLFDPNVTFDAVIAEWMFTELYSGFAEVFNCPLIWSSSLEPHAMVLSLIDEAPNPAYIPDYLSESVPPFTFFERVKELVLINYFSFMRWYYTSTRDEVVYDSNFGAAIRKRGRIPPAYIDVKYNASLMLGNSHVSTGLPISLPQNYKSIAGYHIKDDLPPVSEELRRLLDESKDGVIYFSLGSIVPNNKLPEEMRNAFIEVFGQLKQTVIWKFDKVLPNMPKNIHIEDWAPQLSILAHPNCILFVTHGGLISMVESLHCGKPMIGMPVFGDQFNVVKRMVQKGFGLEVKFDKNLFRNLKFAVDEILSNPKYTERAKEISYVYHHRIAKPSEELVHWVEYVIHTKGAPELRSPALRLPWYQKQYLDLLAVVVLLAYVVVRTVTFLCSLSIGKSNEKVVKKNI